MIPEQIDYTTEACIPDEIRVLGQEDAQKLAIARVRHRGERYALVSERAWLLDLVRRLVEREGALRAVAAARQEVIDGLTKRCEAFDAEVARLRAAGEVVR